MTDTDRAIAQIRAALLSLRGPWIGDGFTKIHRDDVFAALDEREAECERLRGELNDYIGALPGVYYMDPPDGGSVPLGEQVRRMAVDAARYRWLRGDSCPDHSSRWTQWEVRCWKAPFWTGDLRRADLDDAIDAAIDAAKEQA